MASVTSFVGVDDKSITVNGTLSSTPWFVDGKALG